MHEKLEEDKEEKLAETIARVISSLPQLGGYQLLSSRKTLSCSKAVVRTQGKLMTMYYFHNCTGRENKLIHLNAFSLTTALPVTVFMSEKLKE